MTLPKQRKVAAVCGDGAIRLIEQAVPPLRDGTVLVDVQASLVSPGTELGGWRALSAKRANPDSGAEPRPFGYANAGIVVAAGAGVPELSPGDRVACIGAGYAMHADLAVVPHNLCTALPAGVTFVQGSYAMLAATALHALRRGTPQFGEYTAVAGLGIVGQLTAQLHRLAGNFVIGWDTIPFRTKTALGWGIDAVVTIGSEDEVSVTREFTRGAGLDGAVIAYGGDAEATVASIEKCMKVSPDGHPMGTLVVVGSPSFPYTSGLNNMDVRRAARTGAGYHDEPWEHGPDYPPVFMRWTTRTNLALCIRLIEEGKLNVDALTTHCIPRDEVEERVAAILDDPDSILGLALIP